MTREVLVIVSCDLCRAEEVVREAATSSPIVVGTAKPVTLDLCEAHRAEVLEPFLGLLAEYGIPADTPPAKPSTKATRPPAAPRGVGRLGGRPPGVKDREDPEGRISCNVPGCHLNERYGGSANLNALKQHARTRHDLMWADYLAAYGPVTRMNGAPVQTTSEETASPELARVGVAAAR